MDFLGVIICRHIHCRNVQYAYHIARLAPIVRSVLLIKRYKAQEKGDECVCMRASILRNSRFARAYIHVCV